MAAIPLKYSIRNLFTRKLTTALTVMGIALVVFVFTAVLMLANGLQKTLVSTGSPNNVIMLRKGSDQELMSGMSQETGRLAETLPEIARGADGRPIASGEVVVIINLHKIGSNDMGNISVRGVSPGAMQLRPGVHLIEGRMFNIGSREVIVGSAVSKRFQGAQIGQTVKFGGDTWTIVGLFEAGGSGFESEMWGDIDQLLAAFNRQGYFSSVTLRLTEPAAFDALNRSIDEDQRFQQIQVVRETEYYARQSELMATFIRVLGIFITVIFSLGSIIGAMITMYAAVANRTVEIGTLRALGFRRSSVLFAFVVESVLIALTGGVLGLALASFLQFFSISTINFGSFSEIAFGFALSPSIIGWSFFFAVIMGMAGGVLPAVRAARLEILSALRAS